MNTNGFTFDELGLEGLDRQTMERRRAVEQHGMAAGDFFEDVPYFGGLALDHFLGRTDGMNVAEFLEAADDERLEKDERHLFGQAALMELEFRAAEDDGAAVVMHAL